VRAERFQEFLFVFLTQVADSKWMRRTWRDIGLAPDFYSNALRCIVGERVTALNGFDH
jgi:hypothetical protein